MTATIAVGRDFPDGIAVDPSTHYVYVANNGDNTVSVIDESGDAQTGTVIATISVGNTPSAVAVDPFGWWSEPTPSHNVYVTNQNDGTVSVISPEVSPTINGTPSDTTTGTTYWYQFSVTGFPTPTLASSGALPPGLTLAQDGTLSGTPTTPGTYKFVVTASNLLGSATDSVSMTVTRSIHQPNPPCKPLCQ